MFFCSFGHNQSNSLKRLNMPCEFFLGNIRAIRYFEFHSTKRLATIQARLASLTTTSPKASFLNLTEPHQHYSTRWVFWSTVQTDQSNSLKMAGMALCTRRVALNRLKLEVLKYWCAWSSSLVCTDQSNSRKITGNTPRVLLNRFAVLELFYITILVCKNAPNVRRPITILVCKNAPTSTKRPTKRPANTATSNEDREKSLTFV